MARAQPEASGAWLAVTLQHALAEGSAAELEGLALWAMRYSPLVSICQTGAVSGVVADVAASAHLFGGLDALLDDARSQLQALGVSARCAGAPTARGARALTLSTQPLKCWIGPAVWPQHLRQLPLTALELPAPDLEFLASIGVQRVGPCLDLSGGDLDRRCQAPLSLWLAQLSGSAPDPRRSVQVPEHFDRSIELLTETWHSEALLFVCKRLLGELEGLLRGCGGALQSLNISFGHAHEHPDTPLELRLTRPTQSLDALPSLLRERLSRLEFPAPVRRLRVRAIPQLDWQPQRPELWPGAEETAINRDQLVDRLRARLGDSAVRTLGAQADHRPEHAWQTNEANLAAASSRGRRAAAVSAVRGLRPIWLMPEPQPLSRIAGEWQEERGPERIESGWWQSPVMRDYYVLRDPRGRRLWAFRTPAGDWFAHGWFA